MLTAASGHLVLADWNDTARAVPERTLPELFAAQAARTPDAVAVVVGGREPDRTRSWTRGPTGWPGS